MVHISQSRLHLQIHKTATTTYIFSPTKVQAVCDYHGLFLDVDYTWASSVYDAKMFVNSEINRKLQNSRLPKTPQCILPSTTPVLSCIIGDPA